MLTLASYSKSGTCYFLKDKPPPDTAYGLLPNAPPTACYASNAGSVTCGANW